MAHLHYADARPSFRLWLTRLTVSLQWLSDGGPIYHHSIKKPTETIKQTNVCGSRSISSPDVGSFYCLSTVKRRKLSWFGHVYRHDALPKIVLEGFMVVVAEGDLVNHWRTTSKRNWFELFVFLIPVCAFKKLAHTILFFTLPLQWRN